MTDDLNRWHIDTLALHAGHTPDEETLSRAVPLYQTSSYVFRDPARRRPIRAERFRQHLHPADEPDDRRARKRPGRHSRAQGRWPPLRARRQSSTPSRHYLGRTELRHRRQALRRHLYSVQLPLKRFGIEARFVDSSDPANFERAIDENTRLIYTESIGNPKGNVDDFEAIAEVAHRHDLPFIVDNTVTPPPLFNPFDHGADIVVYSLTKMIGGHGTSIGGAIVEKGDFDWKAAGKYPEITEPDPRITGSISGTRSAITTRAVAPGLAYVLKIRAGLASRPRERRFHRSTPGSSSKALRPCPCGPAPARRQRQGGRRDLKSAPSGELGRLCRPADHPDYERSRKYLPLGPGAVFGFGIKGGLEAGKKFINSVKLASHWPTSSTPRPW